MALGSSDLTWYVRPMIYLKTCLVMVSGFCRWVTSGLDPMSKPHHLIISKNRGSLAREREYRCLINSLAYLGANKMGNEKNWWQHKTVACIASAILIIVADKVGLSTTGMMMLGSVLSILVGAKIVMQGLIDRRN